MNHRCVKYIIAADFLRQDRALARSTSGCFIHSRDGFGLCLNTLQ